MNHAGTNVLSGNSLAAIVGELERDWELLTFEERDDGLQLVAALTGHTHGVTLDLRLHLGVGVANELGDLTSQVLRDTLLQLEDLAHLTPAGWLNLAG